MNTRILPALPLVFAVMALAACGSSPSSSGGSAAAEGRTTLIKTGPNATAEAVAAFVGAQPGDVIEFDCGFFDISQTLLLSHTEDVTVKGCGRDRTVLSFKNNNAPEGILTDNARGIRVFDLTVADTAGNGFELRSTDHVTLNNVRAFWTSGGGRFAPNPISASDADEDGSFATALHVDCTDPPTQNPNVPEHSGGDTTSPDYEPHDGAGRYGVYPVKSRNVLVDNSESVGASDAGIYVGQSSNVIIRNSRAVYNVFGFEIENVQVGMYENNLAECNTGGFLIYDLDKLTQYGSRTIMRNNVSRMNNTYNFTEGGFVASVPPGSGAITLSYDRIDVYDNVFEDNNTGGFLHVSYELFPEGAGRPSDKKTDFYTEGVRIFRNTFRNNGNALPTASTNDLQNENIAQVLPAVVGLKNLAGGDQYRGAHILWDGLADERDEGCAYPKQTNDRDDVPESEFHEGKPDYRAEDPEPDCRYNAYKFDSAGNRKLPEWWFSCIDDDNDFSSDSLTYANFNGLKGTDVALALVAGDPAALLNPATYTNLLDFPSSLDMTPHKCVQEYGSNLELLPDVVIPPFERTGEFDTGNSGDVAELCGANVAAGQVNFAASTVECPTLQDYNLFLDPEDPRSQPNSGGVPFVLNTKLFSDYSVKYRVAFMPPGEKASYQTGDITAPNASIVFPVGTIIAKTFAFLDGGNEEVVETRLIIKRTKSNGEAVWASVPYVWETDADTGERVAKLNKIGARKSVTWNFTDPETGVLHQGSTDNYSVPTASQCLTCHANNDQESGSAPIGPKVRNMNRAYRSESTVVTDQSQHEVFGQNQIKYWCDSGLLAGCPSITVDGNGVATNLPRIPKYNVAGDSGLAGGEDIEARARAWLETNCAHCHNERGFAANTGFYVDVFRKVDSSHGICKGVTAAGAEGTNGRTVDIHPGSASDSVLDFRISLASQDSAAARMPPIARSSTDVEAHALIANWIDNVITVDEDKYPNSTACTSN
jgi:parallel beta-helix repeat protein